MSNELRRYCLKAGTAGLFKGPEALVGKKCSMAEQGEVCCWDIQG